jgi:hypothetical protein
VGLSLCRVIENAPHTDIFPRTVQLKCILSIAPLRLDFPDIMATTAQRRQQKQARFLRSMAQDDRRRFHHEWNKRVQSWLHEIHRRGALLRRGEGSELGRIFEIIEQAERLIAACGVEEIVGSETRQLLLAESSRIVARVYGREMFRVITHQWYDLMRSTLGRTGS